MAHRARATAPSTPSGTLQSDGLWVIPERAHDRQLNHGEALWWYFLYGDRPPLPNPTVMDRTGAEARIVPWLAWLERVDGLLYYSTTDWSPDPWTDPWINDGNGDGILFYPPSDATIAFNP